MTATQTCDYDPLNRIADCRKTFAAFRELKSKAVKLSIFRLFIWIISLHHCRNTSRKRFKVIHQCNERKHIITTSLFVTSYKDDKHCSNLCFQLLSCRVFYIMSIIEMFIVTFKWVKWMMSHKLPCLPLVEFHNDFSLFSLPKPNRETRFLFVFFFVWVIKNRWLFSLAVRARFLFAFLLLIMVHLEFTEKTIRERRISEI